MKHIKLFEAFELPKNPGFYPEDSIQSGDTAFCWNFEDGWMVTLLDRVLASKLMDHLEESESRLVDEPKYSNEKGVIFVAIGIPKELSVEFKKENFDITSFENLVNSQEAIENNLEGEFTGSCVFTLKRNHVIGYRWNGGQFCIPIEEYFEKYGETVEIELSNGYSLFGPKYKEAEARAIVDEMEAEMTSEFAQALKNAGESAAMDARDDVYFKGGYKEALSALGFELGI